MVVAIPETILFSHLIATMVPMVTPLMVVIVTVLINLLVPYPDVYHDCIMKWRRENMDPSLLDLPAVLLVPLRIVVLPRRRSQTRRVSLPPLPW